MQNSTTTKNQVTYRSYTCQTANRNESDLCTGQTVPAAALESFVLRQLQRMIKSSGDEPGLVEYFLGESGDKAPFPPGDGFRREGQSLTLSKG